MSIHAITSKPMTKAWWKEAICYQIYPSSFADANGDGRGDLKGITSHLDYLKELGVDVIWLCPIYKGPGIDEGYDISDYRDIDPKFGTLKDWEELLAGVHARGMKLIMDLVVNHSSDQHPWFLESKSSLTNPKRDWYVWKEARWVDPVTGKDVVKGTEGAERREPFNWGSIWNGSAWEWYPETEMYNLHIFAKEQPDLNWENEELRQAIYGDMNFWLDKGIDGFRLDAITHVSKIFADAPITSPTSRYQNCFSQFNHGPMCHTWLKEMHSQVLFREGIMTVGEAGGTSLEEAVEYVSQEREDKELQMIFNGDHMEIYGPFDTGKPEPRNPIALKTAMHKWQSYLTARNCWNSLFSENHDQTRVVNRFGDERIEYRFTSAKAICLYFLTLSGTPYIYQGQEVGMINVPEDWGIEEYLDLVSQGQYYEQLEIKKKTEGPNPDMSGVLAGIRRKARDNSRVPMPWDSSEKAGFTTGKPWMRVNPDNKVANVKDQLVDPNSVLNFFKQSIKVRKAHPILVYGDFKEYDVPSEPEIFSYYRNLDGQTMFVIINMAITDKTVTLPVAGKVVISTLENKGRVEGELVLKPFEGMLIEVEK